MSPVVRILILDDQPHNRYVISKSLREEGYQTEFVDDPDSAWELWREFPPDMMLLNSLSEGFDSFAFLLAIKQKCSDFPVLVYAIRSVDAIDRLKESIAAVLGNKRLVESGMNMRQFRSWEVSISGHSAI
jgi:CheY-like chemotaxis protein